ncbi:MAG: DNA repair protein RecN [Anaerolineaceae bacterium]|nr:DNA repair protein RecN [Anaerolineaceae bacterium]
MLKELRIKDFAIIDHLTLEFDNGLVILTGETGAGKSILIDALLTVMGANSNAGLIRAGCERAEIEVTFQLDQEDDTALIARLKEEELLDENECEMVLLREIRSSGRSVARVNGSKVKVSLLREFGSYMVDIHGQAEHLSLLNTRNHIKLLDRYANIETVLKDYQSDYSILYKVRKELHDLQEAQQDVARRLDLLGFQADEIESAGIKIGEDDELKQERDRLANAESLSKLASRSLIQIEEGETESPPILDLMGDLSAAMEALSRLDPSQVGLANQAVLLLEGISDIENKLRNYVDTIEFNPRRLDQVEERVDLLNRLKRKYGGTLEKVIAFGEKCRADMESLITADERIEALQVQEKQLLKILGGKACSLSAARTIASLAMGEGIENELKDLSMDGARFQVEFRRQPDENGLEMDNGKRVAFNELGIDQIEFLIAPNQGEGFKPLAKTASGGETARLMLALKNILVEADTIPTLIFDEIDQGIGGRLGLVVGEKLWRLGRSHQVLCVTHLPQLAAFGDTHLRVEKHTTQDARTITHVQRVMGDARSEELASMLGGVRDVNRQAADDLMGIARKRQKELLQDVV